MSIIVNLTRQIAKLSVQLAAARADGDIDLAESLEDELNDLEDELERAEEDSRDENFGWS